jgi:hypothetical protein
MVEIVGLDDGMDEIVGLEDGDGDGLLVGMDDIVGVEDGFDDTVGLEDGDEDGASLCAKAPTTINLDAVRAATLAIA